MAAFKHRAYGLNLLSDIELVGLTRAEFDKADVTVHLGPVDDPLSKARREPVTRYKTWEASPGHFLLSLDNIARYLVTDGNEVIIEKEKTARDSEVLAFFTSSIMAAVLQRRRFLTLHASAVHTPKGAVLFMGRSGAGKSTLCRALQQQGLAMMTDDAAAISFDENGQAMLMPAAPTSRLWDDSMDQLGIKTLSTQRLRTELDKYLVPASRFHDKPSKIFKIFSLNPHNKPEFVVRNLDSAARFQALALFTFRKNFYLGQGLGDVYFNSVMQLVNSTPVTKISRPSEPYLIHELVEHVLQDVGLSDPLTQTEVLGAHAVKL